MNEKPALIGPWPGKGRLGVLVFFGKKQSRGFTRSGSNTINWNNFLKRWPGTGKARANRWAVWIRLQPRSKGTIFNRYPFRRREDSIEQALQFRMDAKRKSIFSWIKLVFQRNIRKRLLARIARKTKLVCRTAITEELAPRSVYFKDFYETSFRSNCVNSCFSPRVEEVEHLSSLYRVIS